MKAMKIAICVACLFCATAAFAQASLGMSVLNSEPVVLKSPDHPQRALQMPMGNEQTVMTTFYPTHATGQRPLWEVAPKKVEVPLGDVARELRKEHAAASKAQIIWEN
jgi:hypothetical protein